MGAVEESGAQDMQASPDMLSCEREPIHTPGAIQPHGAMLAVLEESLLVSHVSANLEAILGRPAEAVLGRPLADLIGELACRALATAAQRDGSILDWVHTLAAPQNGALHLRAYRSGRHICIDIEPVRVPPQERSFIISAQSMLDTFKHATSCISLCELAVVGLRAISGFDRVMAYRFHEDGHGEVIAESRTGQLEPYLGLHYPAGDVPPQARQLYLTQRVGAIADSSYLPVPLLVDPMLDDGTPLDLTHSCLRSVSPIHREYMRNMETAASLTIGLAQGADLWGMLVCHHTRPRVASVDLRAVAAVVGQVVSLLLGSLREAEVYAQRFERNAILRALINRLEQPLPLAQTLVAREAELLALENAAGAVVRISGDVFCLGRTPPPLAVERALAVLRPLANGAALAVDDLTLRHPELACCTAEGSGALLLPLACDSDDAILWFRPEQSRTVDWGGNPAEHGSRNPATGLLSPRASFAAWRETVRGHSIPWTQADLTLAGELKSAVATAVAQRTKADLAKLRHYDFLTGLPNRSLLDEQLRDAEGETGTVSSLLFLDLDGFKTVNDTLGHAVGDALLIEVARRLLEAAGPDNLIARIGGDEFVVLCRRLGRDAIAALGERVRQAIETPIETTDRSCNVSASIGIALVDETDGLDLIRAADMAMYAAKKAGGNRAVLFQPSLFSLVSQRFELEQDMREVLGRGGDEFTLLYQPLFGLGSGTKRLVGFEALVRWHHPRRGWMSPATFIPLAEESGLIAPLDNWVLSTALRQGRALRAAYPDANLKMHVNVSVFHLRQPDYCSGIATALEAEGYPPGALCLEIVESIFADSAAASVLADISNLGVTVAIDDFGIGYSSLSYLRRLPINEVKLDRSFMENSEDDPSSIRFLSAVAGMAHAAGKTVVFEGIETQAQFHLALAAGADVVQGFFFAPPLSANAAAELVALHLQLDELPLPMLSQAQHQRSRPDGAGADLRLALIAREASSARDELTRELSRRKAAETDLRESEERFRALLHSTVTEALYLLDLHGNIETWNASAERIKGYTAAEVVGRNFSMFFTPEDVASGQPERILALARDKGHFTTEGWRVRKDGSRFLASVAIDAIRRDDGTLRGFAKMTLDVTDRRIEEAQRAIIIEAMPNGMMIVNEDGIITLINPHAERIFDYAHGTLIGQPIEILVLEGFRAAHGTLRSAFTSGRSDRAMSPRRQFIGRKRDGNPVTIEIMINPVTTPRGRIVVASLFDVTDRVRQPGER